MYLHALSVWSFSYLALLRYSRLQMQKTLVGCNEDEYITPKPWLMLSCQVCCSWHLCCQPNMQFGCSQPAIMPWALYMLAPQNHGIYSRDDLWKKLAEGSRLGTA